MGGTIDFCLIQDLASKCDWTLNITLTSNKIKYMYLPQVSENPQVVALNTSPTSVQGSYFNFQTVIQIKLK